jgi:hypothetical protein
MLLIIFIICIIVYLNYNYFLILENYDENNILFLSENEAYKVLTTDDEFFNKFNKYDMIARDINSICEYHDKIKKSVSNFNDNEQKILINAIKKSDTICYNLNESWLDGKKLTKIKWNLIKINGFEYECGLPHTRFDYIILPEKCIYASFDDLVDTLIHEKLHVYQRLYPNDVKIYLKENNYRKYKLQNKYEKIRANPDTDNWVYINKNGNELKSKYLIKNPRTIKDVEYYPEDNPTNEHPYEKMVYDLINKI